MLGIKTLGNTRQAGSAAETLARKYLERAGLKFISKNYHCRQGEIDLIMSDGNTLVFVEVRARQHGRFGHAVETVQYSKQTKLQTTASHYLQKHYENYPPACRFDIIGIHFDDKLPSYQWIRNAF